MQTGKLLLNFQTKLQVLIGSSKYIYYSRAAVWIGEKGFASADDETSQQIIQA